MQTQTKTKKENLPVKTKTELWYEAITSIIRLYQQPDNTMTIEMICKNLSDNAQGKINELYEIMNSSKPFA